MSSDPSPFFPPELEQEIFETAAYLYPETTSSLVLISRRVYEWIDGIKYSAVTPKGAQWSCSVRHFLRAIQSDSKPASFFHRHVRHVFVNALLIDGSDIQQILSTCSGIQNLMILPSHKHPESIIPSIAALKLRRLSIHWVFILRDMNPRQPMFILLTHFGMFELPLVPNGPQSAAAFLAQLPALTHFAGYSSTIFGGELSALAQEILATCKSLRVFVFRPLRTQGGLKSLPSIDDIRFVYMDLQYPDFADGWIAQTRGGTDYWARADAFVERKRHGEIEPASRCFIQPADDIPECGSF
ncbi:hypothetical protein DFH08DRAFT_55270 [Mycena albidolilacea]|uniref:Uncharacterized protein n=1 Tax=Mycena albidolilacea TaxID=1033008 RepID=A0AAD6Z169_9AGAR|nr:hypothetical protein DFH08DRAFT_55270 [Mycena albidolilacea]